MDKIRILGFAGSLRKASFNKAELLPANAELEIFDLEGIPIFNQDLETTPPEIVSIFKSKIKAADALLIATPEYNYSMPGVLKNAIDWASRPVMENAFYDKPVAIIGASTGFAGSSRAQYHLRQTCVFLNMHPVNKPEFMLPFCKEKIDADGRIADETTRGILAQLLSNLVGWTLRLKPD
jgi:chromate reductase